MNQDKRFIVSNNGTVLDTATGLTWQCETEIPMTWLDAQEYCAKLKLAGGGWRLPTIVELQSIVDYTLLAPAIDSVAFPDTAVCGCGYWSATIHAGDTGLVWLVYFYAGCVGDNDKLGSHYVRAVRGWRTWRRAAARREEHGSR